MICLHAIEHVDDSSGFVGEVFSGVGVLNIR